MPLWKTLMEGLQRLGERRAQAKATAASVAEGNRQAAEMTARITALKEHADALAAAVVQERDARTAALRQYSRVQLERALRVCYAQLDEVTAAYEKMLVERRTRDDRDRDRKRKGGDAADGSDEDEEDEEEGEEAGGSKDSEEGGGAASAATAAASSSASSKDVAGATGAAAAAASAGTAATGGGRRPPPPPPAVPLASYAGVEPCSHCGIHTTRQTERRVCNDCGAIFCKRDGRGVDTLVPDTFSPAAGVSGGLLAVPCLDVYTCACGTHVCAPCYAGASERGSNLYQRCSGCTRVMCYKECKAPAATCEGCGTFPLCRNCAPDHAETCPEVGDSSEEEDSD